MRLRRIRADAELRFAALHQTGDAVGVDLLQLKIDVRVLGAEALDRRAQAVARM